MEKCPYAIHIPMLLKHTVKRNYTVCKKILGVDKIQCYFKKNNKIVNILVYYSKIICL